MTEDQLNALKIYIDVKIAHAMAPIAENEIALMRAEFQLDRSFGEAALSPPLAAGETSGQVTDFSGGASDAESM